MRVTYHASQKYTNEQAKKGIRVDPEFVEREILKLFSEAEKEDSTPGLLIRKMKNEFQESDYYLNKDWRFVVSGNTIVTVEINTFKSYSGLGIQKSKRRKNKKWKH